MNTSFLSTLFTVRKRSQLPRTLLAWTLLALLLIGPSLRGESVQDAAKLARDSMVVITVPDRSGDAQIMGAGFAIRSDMIVTNLHVIGEARPIAVKTRGGKSLDVLEVHASDAAHDLAILRIPKSANLPHLQLANENALEIGQPVVGIGHPLGLTHSVVSGTVAGEQRIRGTDFWQLEMFVEHGDSGGPLLDLAGLVHGVVSMKSTEREAFGFAVKVEQLNRLLESPNPIAMEQWQTLGRIDADRWQPHMGANWRQRGGKITCTGSGDGFGGRALLLRQLDPPDLPFEISVSVKLDDAAGAAGLVFHSNQKNKHFGFYPSNGGIRLTNFDGPSVYSWNIIHNEKTKRYRPGEWNELKVRVEAKQIIGYVNGTEVVRTDQVKQPPGLVGLCTFRGTAAEFKRFRMGKSVQTLQPSDQQIAVLSKQLQTLSDRSKLLDIDLIGQSSEVSSRLKILNAQARELEAQADQLRKLGQDIHIAAICNELRRMTQTEQDQDIDLLRGALMISKLDNPELDIEAYVDQVKDMAARIKANFKQDMTASQRLDQLDQYLFQQNGFHGSRTEYYFAENSYIDRVIDDREGIPIALSVVYIALASQLDLDVVGVGLPGHFMVRHQPAGDDNAEHHQLVDVFNRGKHLTIDDAAQLVFQLTRRRIPKTVFESATNRSILIRMLVNLLNLDKLHEAPESRLRHLEGLVALEPDSVQWRGMRAISRHQVGRKLAALDDLDWILEQKPDGIDINQIRKMRDAFAE